MKSKSITFWVLSSRFNKYLRQQFKKNFTQRFELRPLQDPGGSGVSKSRINSVANFWLVCTQARRSQTVYAWSSWLSSFQIRRRTLLVLGKQNATNNDVTNHYIVRRSWCDMRYNLSGYWPQLYRRRWQYSGHGNVRPRVWHLFHPSVNSTAQVKGNEYRRKYKRRRQSVVSKLCYAGKSEELSNLVDFQSDGDELLNGLDECEIVLWTLSGGNTR